MDQDPVSIMAKDEFIVNQRIMNLVLAGPFPFSRIEFVSSGGVCHGNVTKNGAAALGEAMKHVLNEGSSLILSIVLEGRMAGSEALTHGARVRILYSRKGRQSMAAKCVLVLDDEEMVHEMIEEQLRSAGYREFSVSSPTEAISYFETHRDKIALMIVDLTLPGMTWPEIAAQLQAERPDLPIILVTGHSVHGLSEQETARFAGILIKPFSKSELIEAVKVALAGERKVTA